MSTHSTGAAQTVAVAEPAARRPEAELYAAIVRAQSEVRAALKNSKNAFHGYKYASAEEVITVARDALNANGLALVPVAEAVRRLDNGLPPILSCEYRVIHASGQSLMIETDCPIIEEKGRPLDKATFGARTESLGYVLRDLLLIPRSDAPDVSGRDDTRHAKTETRSQAPTAQAAVAATHASAEAAMAAALERVRTCRNEQELSRAAVAIRNGKILTDAMKLELSTLVEQRKAAMREVPPLKLEAPVADDGDDFPASWSEVADETSVRRQAGEP